MIYELWARVPGEKGRARHMVGRGAAFRRARERGAGLAGAKAAED